MCICACMHSSVTNTVKYVNTIHLDIIKSEINFKLKVKMNKMLIILWFSMGIDHSNPYIHSTTVLCDIYYGGD